MLTMWILLLASVRPVLYSGDLPGRLGGPGRAATVESGRTVGFGQAFIPPAGLATRDSVSELADPKGPVALVDPFIGVRDEESNCVIGPQLPFGSINPSPQTPMGSHDGYSPSQPIRGFGQLHATGTGWGKYGQVFVSPQVGLAVGETEHDSPKRDGLRICCPALAIQHQSRSYTLLPFGDLSLHVSGVRFIEPAGRPHP